MKLADGQILEVEHRVIAAKTVIREEGGLVVAAETSATYRVCIT